METNCQRGQLAESQVPGEWSELLLKARALQCTAVPLPKHSELPLVPGACGLAHVKTLGMSGTVVVLPILKYHL